MSFPAALACLHTMPPLFSLSWTWWGCKPFDVCLMGKIPPELRECRGREWKAMFYGLTAEKHLLVLSGCGCLGLLLSDCSNVATRFLLFSLTLCALFPQFNELRGWLLVGCSSARIWKKGCVDVHGSVCRKASHPSTWQHRKTTWKLSSSCWKMEPTRT